MRLNAQLASLLLSSIVLVGSAHGADEEPVAEKKETSSIERPTFVVRFPSSKRTFVTLQAF